MELTTAGSNSSSFSPQWDKLEIGGKRLFVEMTNS
jgi:hypothetical protein